MNLTDQDAVALRDALQGFTGGGAQGPERSAALERFLKRGLPSTTEEEWRYTDLAEAARRYPLHAARHSRSPAGGPAAAPAHLPPRTLERSARLVFVDGRFRPDLSDRLPAGVRIDDPPGNGPGQFSGPRAAANDGTAPLRDLNMAFLGASVRICVPQGVDSSQPVELLWETGPGGLSTGRVEVTLGKNSTLTLIERHEGAGATLSNNLTLLNCEDHSVLRYTKIQLESVESVHLAQQHLHAGPASRAELMHIDLGARLGRNDLRIELAGADSQVSARGLFCVDAARHLDSHTQIDHAAPRTTSVAVYRGIADDHGRAVFSGNVIVDAGASGADARLTNQNLLLTTTAEIDSTPALQINADDVKCGHGSTTGQLDPSAVFYLRSRGIGEVEAKNLLIEAFAAEIVSGPGDPLLRDALQAIIRGRASSRITKAAHQ